MIKAHTAYVSDGQPGYVRRIVDADTGQAGVKRKENHQKQPAAGESLQLPPVAQHDPEHGADDAEHGAGRPRAVCVGGRLQVIDQR